MSHSNYKDSMLVYSTDNDTFYSHRDSITYPIAGALTQYLITNYGMDNYLEIYKYQGYDLKTLSKLN